MKTILLGSFNPPTNGHLHLISEAFKHGASEIIMIPSWYNEPDTFLYYSRLAMCRSLSDHYYDGKLKTSDLERILARKNNLTEVPTWMTLEYIKYDFQILTTNETYSDIVNWEKGKEILDKYKFLILSSPHLGNIIPGSIEIPDLDISPKSIRTKLKNNEFTQEYIPYPVFKYIYENT